MDMTRWEWIPRFLNAYIDARVEDEVKKRVVALRGEESAGNPLEEVSASASKPAKQKKQKSVASKGSARKTAPTQKPYAAAAKRHRKQDLNHDALLRELQETRRYLDRLEAQLVQITHKAGYTDFLGTSQSNQKTARRSV